MAVHKTAKGYVVPVECIHSNVFINENSIYPTKGKTSSHSIRASVQLMDDWKYCSHSSEKRFRLGNSQIHPTVSNRVIYDEAINRLVEFFDNEKKHQEAMNRIYGLEEQTFDSLYDFEERND